MSGFCGWIGAPTPSPAGTAARMARELPAFGPCRDDLACAADAALVSRGICGESWFQAKGGLWLALEGRPRWTDPALAATAAAHGPAAALAEAYARLGTGLTAGLGGAFAFAILDPGRRRLVAAIDRMGIHTLVHGALPGGGWAVGSTAEAVRAHPALSCSISFQALYDFFYFADRIPAPATIWRGLGKLGPGQMLVVEKGHGEVKPYWRPRYRAAAAHPRQLAEETRATLAAAVGRAVEGEPAAQVGAFLSGGLDSSTVAGLAARRDGPPLAAFTIGFEDPRYDETRYAAIAARHFGLDHRVTLLTPAHVMDCIETIARTYDEPFANSSAVPTYLCARTAREAGISVLLAGDGGDELFAGNERYVKDRPFQLYGRLPAALRRRMIEPVALSLPVTVPFWPLRMAVKYVRRARRPMAERVCGDNLFALHPPHVIFSPDLLAEVDLKAPLRHAASLLAGADAETDLQRFLVLDHHLTLADGDLRKVGRMCEMAGVRVRYPMLDDEVVALSTRLPSHLLCRGGRLRAFYKECFAPLLPPEIIAKPKHGFGLPYAEFLAGYKPLADLSRAALSSLRARGWFQTGFLDALAAGLGGRGPLNGVLWDFVTLSLWLDSRKI